MQRLRHMTGRVFAVSDIHVDYKVNRELVAKWSQTDYTSDCLILAGDVTDNLTLLEETLTKLRQTFAKVFFVPGSTLTRFSATGK